MAGVVKMLRTLRRQLSEGIGFPVLVKAAHDGGGRGMRAVERLEDLSVALDMASAEAQAAFGDGTVFLERYVRGAKHVEVQILGDTLGNLIHLRERKCSVQFRLQKVVEEAPCGALQGVRCLRVIDPMHDMDGAKRAGFEEVVGGICCTTSPLRRDEHYDAKIAELDDYPAIASLYIKHPAC